MSARMDYVRHVAHSHRCLLPSVTDMQSATVHIIRYIN